MRVGRRIELVQQRRRAHTHRPVLVGERVVSSGVAARAPYFASGRERRGARDIGRVAAGRADTPRSSAATAAGGFSSAIAFAAAARTTGSSAFS